MSVRRGIDNDAVHFIIVRLLNHVDQIPLVIRLKAGYFDAQTFGLILYHSRQFLIGGPAVDLGLTDAQQIHIRPVNYQDMH